MHERIRSVVVGIAAIGEEDPQLAPALELAQALGCLLHVVHAFCLPDPILAPLDVVESTHRQGLDERRAQVLSLLEARVGTPYRTGAVFCHAVPGSPADAIVDVAESESADLVIVGASRRGSVASTLLGTTAQRVLRASPAPVLVNRRPGQGPPRRILLTTDLSDGSARVHERGMELVALLWGLRDAEVYSLLVAGEDVLLPRPVQQIAMRQVAEVRLAAFLEQTPSGGQGVKGRVRLGISGTEILAEAEEWGADLVILGTQGRTGMSRFLIGSVAETVSRKARCDVLLFPVAAMTPLKVPTSKVDREV